MATISRLSIGRYKVRFFNPNSSCRSESATMHWQLLTINGKEFSWLSVEHTTDPKSQQEVVAKDIESERNITVNENDLRAIDQLNKDQRNAYEQILNAIMSNSSTSFFVDGPWGTEKTFLYRALLAKIKSTGGIALATVTSGIAASILPGGCTAHSRFKIPLHDDDSKSCHVRKQTVIAQLIRDAQLIIWDEASMVKW